MSLKKLLIEIGGVNLGKQVACFDATADIDFAARDITADTGENRRLIIGLEPAGKIEQPMLFRTAGVETVTSEPRVSRALVLSRARHCCRVSMPVKPTNTAASDEK